MEEISTIISLINAIITLILVIIFIVMAWNVAKIKKSILRSQEFIVAFAKKEGVTKEHKCLACSKAYEIQINQPKGYYRCPNCGDNNYID
jgi:DNA-directed RNA polymerase subunit RPC12/RpoP